MALRGYHQTPGMPLFHHAGIDTRFDLQMQSTPPITDI